MARQSKPAWWPEDQEWRPLVCQECGVDISTNGVFNEGRWCPTHACREHGPFDSPQLQLGLWDRAEPPPDPTEGTCRDCGETVAVFLYAARVPPPWWYACHHYTHGQACPGAGYPVVEQVTPR